MAEPARSVLPLDQVEAGTLLHPLFQRAAAAAGARVLFVKGPAAVAQGLRPERPSADVDALIDPAHRDDFEAALAELGWHRVDTSGNAHVIPEHSAQFRHDDWPCELDLHHAFPGFYAAPEVVFETLWSRRTTIEVAHQPIEVPEVVAHTVVTALHALRHPDLQPNAGDLDHLVRACTALQPEALDELTELAATTCSTDALEPFLSRVGARVPEEGRVPPEQLRDWRTEAAMGTTLGVSWVSELRRTPTRGWPRLLWRAVWLPEGDLRHRQPDLGPGRWHVLVGRVVRLRQGLRDLPRAIRIVSSQRGPR